MKQTNFKIPEHLIILLQRYAKENHMSASAVVRQLIDKLIRNHKWTENQPGNQTLKLSMKKQQASQPLTISEDTRRNTSKHSSGALRNRTNSMTI